MTSTLWRVTLPDGRWFDMEKCRTFKESTRWDGRNCISRATGSQWDHEQLTLTPSGVWILNSWSDWQGSEDVYEEVEPDFAKKWLSFHEEIEACNELFPGFDASLEI